jgi:hypothetical protein
MRRNTNNLRRVSKSGDLGDSSVLSGTFVSSNNLYKGKEGAEEWKPSLVLIVCAVVGLPSWTYAVFFATSNWMEYVVTTVAIIFLSAAAYERVCAAKKHQSQKRIKELEIEQRLQWLEEIHY